MAETDFLITLPSNSNMSTNPNNEQSNFTVKLASPLNLEGDWEAALVSLQYTPNWLTIHRSLNLAIFIVKHEGSDGRRPDLQTHQSLKHIAGFTKAAELLGKHGLKPMQIQEQLPPNTILRLATLVPKYFESIEELGGQICKVFNEACSGDDVKLLYEFDYVTKRGRFIVKGADIMIAVENYLFLGEMLGHSMTWVKCDQCADYTQRVVTTSPHYFILQLTGHKEPKMPRVNSFWIYTNITQYQQVGDAKAPLLSIIPAKKGNGVRVHYTVNPVHFLALNRNHIPEISIQITDDRGKKIPFIVGPNEDNLVCCLRFRRRKALTPI